MSLVNGPVFKPAELLTAEDFLASNSFKDNPLGTPKDPLVPISILVDDDVSASADEDTKQLFMAGLVDQNFLTSYHFHPTGHFPNYLVPRDSYKLKQFVPNKICIAMHQFENRKVFTVGGEDDGLKRRVCARARFINEIKFQKWMTLRNAVLVREGLELPDEVIVRWKGTVPYSWSIKDTDGLPGPFHYFFSKKRNVKFGDQHDGLVQLCLAMVEYLKANRVPR